MKLEVRNISVASLITSAMPVIVFALGMLGGVVTFLLVPNPQLDMMSIGHKIQSIGFFSLLYVIIVSALLVFIAFLYNIMTGVLGMKGVAFDIEEISDRE